MVLARNTKIVVRGFVPDGDGGYQPLENLTQEERSEFSKKLVNRMGESLNNWFSSHPEEYNVLGG